MITLTELENGYSTLTSTSTPAAQPHGAGSTFPDNDAGHAERFVNWCKGSITYVPETKGWYVWEGKSWREDTDGGIIRLAVEHAHVMLSEAAKLKYDEARAKAAKMALAMGSVKRIQSMLEIVRCHRAVVVHLEKLDANPFLLGVQNGVVNLRTGEFREARRSDYVTRKAGAAFAKNAKCPTWERVINEVLGDENLIGYLQKYIGYTLTADVSDQTFLFLVGSGRNGKSTVLEVLQKLLGQYGQRASQSVFVASPHGNEPSNDIARLAGARFVVGSEVEECSRLAENRVKDLTGGDTVTGRFLYKQPFDFKPVLKLWLFGNHKPEVRGTDEGIWRRVRMIPFNVRITSERVDPHLPFKLAGELSGILNWALEGTRKWLAEGLKAPSIVLNAGIEYREEEDLLADFLAEATVAVPNERVGRSALYAAYKAWGDATGLRHLLSPRALVRRMRDRGTKEARDAQGRYWLDIALRASDHQVS